MSFRITHDTGVSRPHTGAAVIALTTEFYRQRLRRMETINPHEFNRLVSVLEIHDPGKVLETQTFIVPVNITYYPLKGPAEPAEQHCRKPHGRTLPEGP